MIVTYHNNLGGWAYARLIQLTAYPSAESGLHSDNDDSSKRSICDIKLPKCDFGFSTVVQHSPPHLYTPVYILILQYDISIHIGLIQDESHPQFGSQTFTVCMLIKTAHTVAMAKLPTVHTARTLLFHVLLRVLSGFHMRKGYPH